MYIISLSEKNVECSIRNTNEFEILTFIVPTLVFTLQKIRIGTHQEILEQTEKGILNFEIWNEAHDIQNDDDI